MAKYTINPGAVSPVDAMQVPLQLTPFETWALSVGLFGGAIQPGYWVMKDAAGALFYMTPDQWQAANPVAVPLQ